MTHTTLLAQLSDADTLMPEALANMNQALIEEGKSNLSTNYRIVRLPSISITGPMIQYPETEVGDARDAVLARQLKRRLNLPRNSLEFRTKEDADAFLMAYCESLMAVMRKRVAAMNSTYRYQIDGNFTSGTSVTDTKGAADAGPLYINGGVRDTVTGKLICVCGGTAGLAFAALVADQLNKHSMDALGHAGEVGSQMGVVHRLSRMSDPEHGDIAMFKDQLSV